MNHHHLAGGWGSNSDNELFAYDSRYFPSILDRVPISTTNIPRFKYGFTALAIPQKVPLYGLGPVEDGVEEQRILMFGGCTQGGYSGDCSGKICLFICLFVCLFVCLYYYYYCYQ